MNDEDIVTGKDYAQQQGMENHAQFILATSKRMKAQGVISGYWNGKTKGKKVEARIDFERWLVDCPDPICSGAEMVCLETEVFFCFSCGNVNNDYFGISVKFPTQNKRQQIYDELDLRPQNRFPNQNRIMSVETARAVFPGLGRSWNVGETIADLKKQREIYPADHGHVTIKIPPRQVKNERPKTDAEKAGII